MTDDAASSLKSRLGDLETSIQEALDVATDAAALERIRVDYLGRNGKLRELLQSLGSLERQDRPTFGAEINRIRSGLERSLKERQHQAKAQPKVTIDRSLPGHVPAIGHQHPVTQVVDEILGTFEKLGFSVVEGPEIETPFYNFEALNVPPDHPSRESFDTFFLKGAGKEEYLLRSHTSPMQVRYMQKHKPPFRIVVPGRVFRPDAVDASHSFQFHQIEGLVVEPGVTFADLKGLLMAFARQLFGPKTKMRFRPHYFPFTEPSAEVDLLWTFTRREGSRVIKKQKWLEILGAGVVHPHVFKAAGYDPKTTQGLAFGLGIERIAMLKYGVEDIRLFFENDVRFLHQF